MNAITLMRDLPVHKLTVDDVRAMLESGVLDQTAKYELIEGVLYDVPLENPPHRDYKSEIIIHLARTLPDEWFVMAEAQLDLAPISAPSPDIHVFPSAIATADLKPEQVALVIEVSDTSLRQDIGMKADLYAHYGVQEYWVVDIARRVILVHRERDGDGWAAPVEVAADETAVCAAVPALKLRLRDLKRAG